VPAVPPPSSATGATILLVDDEDPVRRAMARALARAGFRVVPAADAEDALTQVQAGLRPDAVVTDMMMPGMDGAALARALRASRPELPVILASGFAEGGAPADVMAQPRTLWLGKPYAAADVVMRLTALLAQVPPDRVRPDG
jgi:two-component system cell cycle sensor histidine kinase/response regulator CckA